MINPKLIYAIYAYVVHDYYGCDSGCCGYRLYLCDNKDEIIESQFCFDHCDEENDFEEWVTELIREYYRDVDIRYDLCEFVGWC